MTDDIILSVATLALALATLGLVWLTRAQIRLTQNPIIGIQIEKLIRKGSSNPPQFEVSVKIENIGKAAAHEITIDSEIRLKDTKIKDKTIIPAREYPFFYPYLKSDEQLSPTVSPIKLNYDTTFIDQILMTKAQPEDDSAIVTVYVYYKNNLDHYYKSYFESYVPLIDVKGQSPSADIDIQFHKRKFVKELKLGSGPIIESDFAKELKTRDDNRRSFYQ